ncbi:bifunctional 23S rRNA (guanine(2069)-N(7))-methyltransferase RlmK/23S rRNA (guanine(2445)-N(2))-methyltransferase RlmL [Thalassotalea sp. PS06]|uniref:bifunctional 23S rRNA (guanine(2069)-N(7))-methyltransferase RlmK/23S rRNA (guanine(2445)-N(2))-methyltransferase RlmL n=1 Tax=Thalassotalea sp. PS06 TaxID=2594005 RepID=UPI001164B69C|nr:bifunctional 23S rRNA (guanine(2069)-N(7))-methyltransferase RlmK/23S rRNA (guanine(2445)-N(2))-methyltransferase RlmL [Thalassotalea sp. PS06]QDP01385.1 bifunctional 23S rRNA (guanine(2069)-N(7))-methyltransferase RlmK/23S rRNA (guanine(2445)-N(2))-methyltransferase RlmL [Thalassotalea sp. PS06]
MQNFLALTSFGIESVLAEEITQLGGQQVVQKPEGVYFQTDLANAYQIVLKTRMASRVLMQLSEPVGVNSKDDLYNAAIDINWHEQFNSDALFAVDFVGKNKAIRDSQFGGLTVKDAIVDKFRDAGLERPNVEKSRPDIRIQARLLKNQVHFYLDFSGRSLFNRGYRQNTGSAPMKENLAAALIVRSGWLEDTSRPLIDPMCGSGTILIEAIAMAADLAPGANREFWGFDFWLGHDQSMWKSILEKEIQLNEQKLEQLTIKVHGFDMDERVLKTAKANARSAGLSDFIEFKVGNAEALKNPFKAPGQIIFNPPYGERIGSLPELVATFTKLGQRLKQDFVNWQVAIITANPETLKLLKLASHKRYKFKNGPLDCVFALYDISEEQAERGTGQNIDASQPSAFANRLKKNIKGMKGWLKQNDVNCYRIYDADIPEYNVAVDVYDDHLVIQEYAAPKNIEESKTSARLQEVIFWAPQVMGVAPDKVSLKTREKKKGKSQYQSLSKTDRSMVVHEYQAKLKVNLWDYLDTGLFLDHRKTRQIVAKKAKGKTLLNLFAYTGSVSLQAALHGASEVTTVDMSHTYLDWAQDNFELNGLRSHKYQFVQSDCLQWLENNTQTYDLVFIDPPTFSNSKRMDKTFDVQRDHVDLLRLGMKAVAAGGELIFTNNKRHFKMDFDALQELGFTAREITEQSRDMDFKRNKHIHNSWIITRD